MIRAVNTGRQELGPDALATLGQLCNISVGPDPGQATVSTRTLRGIVGERVLLALRSSSLMFYLFSPRCAPITTPMAMAMAIQDAGTQTMSEVCIGSGSTVRPSPPLATRRVSHPHPHAHPDTRALHVPPQGSEVSDPWRKALVGDPDKTGVGLNVFTDVKPIQ